VDLNVQELSSSEKEIEITLKYEEVKNDIEAEVKKQSKKIQIPGFRRGKIPAIVLKKRFGDSLEYDASEKIANQHFWKIADKESLNPIGQPRMTDLKFEPGKDLKFKVIYDVVPIIDVKDYTEQKIEIPEFMVKDSDVEKEIKHIRHSNKTLEKAELVGNDKNYLLDVQLYRLNKNGDPENDKGEKIQIDLTNEGVNKDIIVNAKGKKTGDFFTFGFDDERTIKNDKNEDEKIKEHFDYKAQINEIKKILLPELNEEFIKKISKDKVSNEEDLKKEIRKDIQNYYDHKEEEILRGKLMSTIIKNNDFTPPTTMVNNIMEHLVKNEEEYSKKQRIPIPSHQELEERFASTAQNDVKWYLIKTEILKKENITIADDELKKLAEKEAEKTGISSDKLLNYYKNSGQNEKLLDQKLFDFLKEKNNIVKLDPEKIIKSETKEQQ